MLNSLLAQSKKALETQFSTTNIVIDGKLNERDWESAAMAVDFTQTEPKPGEKASKKSFVKVLYDNSALYVGAYLQDTSESAVLRELTPRDEIGNADWFGVFIDAYKDGINGVGFLVTASGIQIDYKYSVFGEDGSWNAVWRSAVTVTDTGWFAEYRIPYSALRFPEKPKQEWHINFQRYMRGNREKSSWNYVDPTINGFLNQSGLLQGIEGITPPLRLQLLPYLSAYYDFIGNQSARSINGGMDIKYGISDAFTLDMTLIPDFGQVQSDNQVLNLSPFEVQFQERRQFFTEGIELFNKGNLFYSRRIGNRPIGYFDVYSELNEGDSLLENPQLTKLLNATKVSGRTDKGTGIGVFNAFSGKSEAKILRANGDIETVETSPFTNYNVSVIDQNLANNSYVTLINSNVTRNGEYYDANVTGLEFTLRNKSLKYAVGGGAAISNLIDSSGTETGNRHSLRFQKASGNFTYTLGYESLSDRFDPNDLGFLAFNNFTNYYLNASYNIFKPFGGFNRAGINFNSDYSRLYKPNTFANYAVNVNSWWVLKSFHGFGGGFTAEPVVTYDFFEPRSPGRYYTFPTNGTGNVWISSDYRRAFALDVDLAYRHFNESGRNIAEYTVSPRFRVNNHLSFIYSYSKVNFRNDVGFAQTNDGRFSKTDYGFSSSDILFGIRDRNIHTQVLTAKYTINDKMGFNFRLRHYWATVRYNSLHLLQEDGNLSDKLDFNGRDATGESFFDNSFNAFNIDMVYTFVFSPGSELRLVWKNIIQTSQNQEVLSYKDNNRYLFDQNQLNSFSVKFLYFIDYGLWANNRALKKQQIK